MDSTPKRKKRYVIILFRSIKYVSKQESIQKNMENLLYL